MDSYEFQVHVTFIVPSVQTTLTVGSCRVQSRSRVSRRLHPRALSKATIVLFIEITEVVSRVNYFNAFFPLFFLTSKHLEKNCV